MIQLWILATRETPLDAIKSGHDKVICGDCPLRGLNGKTRACYVNAGQAPQGIWRAFKRGAYPKLDDTSVFTDRVIRFGAYGDPTHLPYSLAKEISEQSQGWTGYTHQWRNPLLQSWRNLVMASVETEEQATEAQSMGWRTFRIGKTKTKTEIQCPNTTHGVQCADCKLCRGSSIKAKSIVIQAHGTGKNYIQN